MPQCHPHLSLPFPDYKAPITGYQFRVTGYRLRVGLQVCGEEPEGCGGEVGAVEGDIQFVGAVCGVCDRHAHAVQFRFHNGPVGASRGGILVKDTLASIC